MSVTTTRRLVAGILVAFTAGTLSAASTAWQNGRFNIDVAGVLHRSDIFLDRPNTQAGEAMPLGNGRLGVAVWAGDGFTAQLNRADTLPDRLSPGQVVIPGLSVLTAASDYSGRLDLYNGEIREQGGGMKATIYVQPETDTLVIDVRGANPNRPETALLRLWAPRRAHATASGAAGILSESWSDDTRPEPLDDVSVHSPASLLRPEMYPQRLPIPSPSHSLLRPERTGTSASWSRHRSTTGQGMRSALPARPSSPDQLTPTGVGGMPSGAALQ